MARQRGDGGTKLTPKKGTKVKSILSAVEQHPDLTTREIGRLVGCDHSNVVRTLQRYGVELEVVDRFTEQKERIFRGLQEKIVKAITDEEIQKASMMQKFSALGILEDKLHQSSQAGRSGVAIQINVNGDPRTVEVVPS